jgi:hypothetical protein
MHGHSSRTCRTPKHLTYLYQAFFKQNAVETNFIHKEDLEGYNAYLDVNIYLDVYDFFENPDKIDNMLSGGILRDD